MARPVLEDKQAIGEAELAFHLFDPSITAQSGGRRAAHCPKALARPFEDVAPATASSPCGAAGSGSLRVGFIAHDGSGWRRADAAHDALRSWSHAFGVAESVLDPLTRLVSRHMITHLSQDDEAAKWMALVFPSERVHRWRLLVLRPWRVPQRRMVRSDEEKVWLLEAGYRAVWGSSKDNAKEITEHCGRGLVAAITQPGRLLPGAGARRGINWRRVCSHSGLWSRGRDDTEMRPSRCAY